MREYEGHRVFLKSLSVRGAIEVHNMALKHGYGAICSEELGGVIADLYVQLPVGSPEPKPPWVVIIEHDCKKLAEEMGKP